jgi:hypothetical protein
VLDSTPGSYLNAIGQAFRQVRWLSKLLIEDILDAVDTTNIIDKHLNVCHRTMYQSLQITVAAYGLRGVPDLLRQPALRDQEELQICIGQSPRRRVCRRTTTVTNSSTSLANVVAAPLGTASLIS